MVETVRGLVRPTVTWGLFAACIAFEAISVVNGNPVDEWFVGLVAMVGTFWFVDRVNNR